MANYERRTFRVTDKFGKALAGAEVRIEEEVAGFPLATLYEDPAGAIPLNNPLTSDSEGKVYYHAAAGQYKETVRANGFANIDRYVRIGIAEVTLAVQLTFDSATADADPGAGKFRLNHATPASATAVYVDNADSVGNDITAWLDSIDNNNDTSNRGLLQLWDIDDPTAWRMYKVTGSVVDGTGYRKLTVTNIAGGGTFSGLVALTFLPMSDKGQVSGPGASAAGELAAYSDTSGVALGRTNTLTGIVKAASGVPSAAVAGTDYLAPAAIGVTVQAYDVNTAKLNAVQSWSKPQKATALALTHNTAWDGAAASLLTVAPNGSNFTISNPTGATPISGQFYTFVISYATTHTISWGNQFKGISGITWTNTAAAVDTVSFYYNGTNFIYVGHALNGGA